MSKIIIMKGLPASGKSTKAKELLEQGNTVRINKDLLRTLLHFDKFNGRNEGHTKDAARKLADWFLVNGVNVIIDDTNLNPGVVQSWKDLAKIHNAKIEYQDMTEVSVEECIARDSKRDKKVGRPVIVNMALQYGLYPKPEKGYVICDIDGTLADIRHRLHFVKVPEGEKKDWKGFFDAMVDDTPRYDVMGILTGYLNNGYKVVFMSGRPDNYKQQTVQFIENTIPEYVTLIMRNAGDKRPDTEVKKDLLDRYFPDKSIVKAVIDDRPSVIRMWQENGLEVIDVGNGVEF